MQTVVCCLVPETFLWKNCHQCPPIVPPKQHRLHNGCCTFPLAATIACSCSQSFHHVSALHFGFYWEWLLPSVWVAGRRPFSWNGSWEAVKARRCAGGHSGCSYVQMQWQDIFSFPLRGEAVDPANPGVGNPRLWSMRLSVHWLPLALTKKKVNAYSLFLFLHSFNCSHTQFSNFLIPPHPLRNDKITVMRLQWRCNAKSNIKSLSHRIFVVDLQIHLYVPLDQLLEVLCGRILNVGHSFRDRTALSAVGWGFTLTADIRQMLWRCAGMIQWGHNTLWNACGWTQHSLCKRQNWLYGTHGWNPNCVAWISHLEKDEPKYKLRQNFAHFNSY